MFMFYKCLTTTVFCDTMFSNMGNRLHFATAFVENSGVHFKERRLQYANVTRNR